MAALKALLLLLALAGPAGAAEAINSYRSAAAEASHVFCGGAAPAKAPCFLRSLYVTNGAVAGYLMTFNATTAPADGAVTPVECRAVPANSTGIIDLAQTSEPYVTGLTAVFSTTGCFSKTSANAFFHARVQ